MKKQLVMALGFGLALAMSTASWAQAAGAGGSAGGSSAGGSVGGASGWIDWGRTIYGAGSECSIGPVAKPESFEPQHRSSI